MTSTHRGHGHVIAKGAALGPILAELMGRTNGLNRGRGGSMHVADLSLGVLGANGMVAGGIPFALGATWAAAQDGDNRVAATFFGDGGLAQGLLHECMNWAALWQLPVVFVCEDNGYAVSLPASASAAGSPVARAQSYGMAAQEVDGMDAEEVYAAASMAVQRARAGAGPSYLHMKTYRFRGHHLGEAVLKLAYRSDAEIARWQQRDPMKILADRIEPGAREAIDADVEAELKAAIDYARTGPAPDPHTALEFQVPSLLYVAFDQVVNQAQKLSIMTGGQARVPVTYVFPGSGARLGLAGQHSDHPYAILAQAGVKTVVPATPADAYALFRTAIRDDDPVAVFAPAALLGNREDLGDQVDQVALGSGRIHRPGTDVTLVAVGHLVPAALAVADELAAADVSVEVFDPRSIYPFDWDLLRASVDKTGRLVVADDTDKTCGLAAEIIATIVESAHLRSAPRRVTRADVAVPFAPALERAVIPDRESIATAVMDVVGKVAAR